MKRSSLYAAGFGLVLASCTTQREPDPCLPEHFNAKACEAATSGGGYYSRGTWVPMTYSHAYPYYYGNYGAYVSRGGKVRASSPEAYAPPARATPATPAPAEPVSRGGFGSKGSAGAGE
jgi:hypothetical protein